MTLRTGEDECGPVLWLKPDLLHDEFALPLHDVETGAERLVRAWEPVATAPLEGAGEELRPASSLAKALDYLTGRVDDGSGFREPLQAGDWEKGYEPPEWVRIRVVDIVLRFLEQRPAAAPSERLRLLRLGYDLRLERVKALRERPTNSVLVEDAERDLRDYVERWLETLRGFDFAVFLTTRQHEESSAEEDISAVASSGCADGVPLIASLREQLVVNWALVARLWPLHAQRLESNWQPMRRGILGFVRAWACAVAVNVFLLLWVLVAAVHVALVPLRLCPAQLLVGLWAGFGGIAFALILAWPDLGRAWVPRLGAVSAVGYLVLMQFDVLREMNDFGHGLWPVWAGVLSAALALVYVIFAEVANHTRLPWRKTLARSAHLLGLGLAQSLAVGFVGYCVVTSHVPPEGVVPLPWVWAPMALLIGLVAQTLWQREAITEPI